MSLTNTLRQHWHSFRWPLSFTVWYVFGGLTATELGYGEAFFYVSVPMFFYALYRGVSPWTQKTAPYFHVVWWAMVVPFLLAIPLSVGWHFGAHMWHAVRT